LRPGNSRNSFQKRFAQAFDHSANRPENLGARPLARVGTKNTA
jgi:hypothetical protein